jgi:very-short-patch-repair endonuclease
MREQIRKDNLRNKELKEKGYRVIRLWETNIRLLTIDKFKEKLNE